MLNSALKTFTKHWDFLNRNAVLALTAFPGSYYITLRELSVIHCHIFSIIHFGVGPLCWLDANVTPVLRKERHSAPVIVDLYRLLEFLQSHAMEHIINANVIDHMHTNRIIIKSQCGFLNRHSTCPNLPELVHELPLYWCNVYWLSKCIWYFVTSWTNFAAWKLWNNEVVKLANLISEKVHLTCWVL